MEVVGVTKKNVISAPPELKEKIEKVNKEIYEKIDRVTKYCIYYMSSMCKVQTNSFGVLCSAFEMELLVNYFR